VQWGDRRVTLTSKRIDRGMASAAKAAALSVDRYKMGAVVYLGSRVVATASNTMTKSDPKACDHYEWPFPHAEFNAVKKLSVCPTKCIMYVTRTMADGSLGNSKPCSECQKMLKSYGIKTVYYTDGEGNVKQL